MNRYIGIGLAAVVIVAAALGFSRCTTDQQVATGESTAESGQTATADAGGTTASSADGGATTASTGSEATAGQSELSDSEGQQATATTGAASASQTPSFDVVRIDAAGGMVIAGRAAPGAVVSVTSDGQVIGTVTADAHGEWVLLPGAALPPGNHQLGLTATLPSGEVVTASQQVMIVMPGAGMDLAGQAASQPDQALAVLVPTDENSAAVVMQAPSAADANGTTSSSGASTESSGSDQGGGIASGALTLDSVDYGDSGDVTVGGKAPAGSQVNVYLDNKLIGGTTADSSGHWQVSPDGAVEPGLHTLRVDQIGSDGAVMSRVETPFERSGPVALRAGQQFVVQPGNSLWRIARRAYGNGLRYTVIYQANQSQIRDPDLIYPGQVFAIPEDSVTSTQ
ncbi:MAG: LysM peptidoglycan-binding domain-containing protein [Dongiaceae bacterium]